MENRELHCGACGAEAWFVNPPCPDEHGSDCPEWTCTRCDDAILAEPRQKREPVRTAA